VWAALFAVGTPGPASAQSHVALVASDGVSIAGTFFEPSRRPAPMVLLLHMSTRTRADWSFVASRLAERGVGALAIDLRGHGESARPRADSGEDGAGPLGAVRDVEAALAWLKYRPDAMPGRLAVVGASLGANLAVVAAASEPQVRAIVLMSVTLDFRGVRTEAAFRQLGDRAALLVTSREDGYATRSARELVTAAPTALRELRVLEGAGHGTTMMTRAPEQAGAVVDWLCARLL
jgi:alpha-beta hydrolase superfamily lysophospholipase